MSNSLAVSEKKEVVTKNKLVQFVRCEVAGQLFGIAVDYVEDALKVQPITSIPLARGEIAGILNLRGRVVTAIDLKKALQIKCSNKVKNHMSVVVSFETELFSLLVDDVSEVISVSLENIIPVPDNIPKSWKDVACGVYMLKDRLMVILDLEKFMTYMGVSK